MLTRNSKTDGRPGTQLPNFPKMNAPNRKTPMGRPSLRPLLLFCFSAISVVLPGGEPSFLDNKVFTAHDTLLCDGDANEDARICIEGLAWPPAQFEVRCDAPLPQLGDAIVSFPSPLPSGNANNDRVTMEWYLARNNENEPIEAPAVVVVHESGSRMTVGRVFARGFQSAHLHAFLIHLPYYGSRRTGNERPSQDAAIKAIRQAVADVRRARDAVAALPLVENGKVSLQGTSLGGFVAATAASLDSGRPHQGYENVFLLLAGGDLMDVIQSGQKDVAKFRQKLQQSGVAIDQIESVVMQVEPTRVAHRLDPKRTWLYSAEFDQVVPMKNALALATSARLDSSHHQRLLANHYSGVVYIPFVLAQMTARIRGD